MIASSSLLFAASPTKIQNEIPVLEREPGQCKLIIIIMIVAMMAVMMVMMMMMMMMMTIVMMMVRAGDCDGDGDAADDRHDGDDDDGDGECTGDHHADDDETAMTMTVMMTMMMSI